MRLDSQTMQRIEALAGRAGNTAFKARKHDLIAECLRLLETGGNPDRHLAHEELNALTSHFGRQRADKCRTAQGDGAK